MGFRDSKKQVLECLESGAIRHEQRGDIDVKNFLAVGAISNEEVSKLIKRARGDNYECSYHHLDASIKVHILKVSVQGKRWYIKWYFISPNSVFISVHE